MRRLRFEVAYDGADFNGWQKQPGLPTVQSTLEEAIGIVAGKPVLVAGSGRTDAGVHALAQVAAVTLDNPIPADNFEKAVNRLLPAAIRVGKVCEASLDFHPRFDALRKTYEYRIYRERICPPFLPRYVFHYPYPLNEDAMAEAALLLKGAHDFTSFAATDDRDARGISKVRTLFESAVSRRGDLLLYRVTGSGFLKHMVRNIVGVLLQAGKGNLIHSDILARLDPINEIPAGPTVPPSGLFLVSVEYPAEAQKPNDTVTSS